MTAIPPASLAAAYHEVAGEIASAAADAARPPGSVRLMAASKVQPAARIEEVLDLGHRLFGENRVAEAAEKWPGLRERFPEAELHLIGPLQTNKVRDAVALFDAIESLDRPKLAAALAAAMEKAGRRPACYIQVNTGREAQKSGIAPELADAFIQECVHRLALPIAGLMCVPPAGEDAGPHFASLAAMAARHGLAELSMGMSGDYREAIRYGATIVRVGTAIFGARG